MQPSATISVKPDPARRQAPAPETGLAGRIAWVTGASSGIGRAVAEHLAGSGWTVAVSARSAATLEEMAASLPAIRPYPLDVADEAATAATIAAIEAELGPIDRAILNAGTYVPTPAAEFRVADLRRMMEINYMGVAHGLAALFPPMRARGRGQIGVVSSVAGYSGLPLGGGYGATKAALINLCEALKPDFDRHGIDLRLICPGFVKTPLTDKNEFDMPFIIGSDEAADRIVAGLDGDRFEIAFPRPLVWRLKLARLLPYRMFFALMRRIAKL